MTFNVQTQKRNNAFLRQSLVSPHLAHLPGAIRIPLMVLLSSNSNVVEHTKTPLFLPPDDLGNTARRGSTRLYSTTTAATAATIAAIAAVTQPTPMPDMDLAKVGVLVLGNRRF
jgi:hypothetical protein